MTSAPGDGDGISDAPAGTNWRECPQVELSVILRHASDAFYEQGFHGTTVRDIASRVGVTVPALYYHHQNKEAILVAVLGAVMEDLLPRGEAAVAEGGGDAVLEMANLVESIVLHLTVRARLASLDSEYRYLGPEARTEYVELRRANEVLMRSVVARGAEQGVFVVADPAETTRAVLGMLQAIARWYHESGSLNPGQVAQRYVDMSLGLLGASASDRARVAARYEELAAAAAEDDDPPTAATGAARPV